MRCPHCSVHFHARTFNTTLKTRLETDGSPWHAHLSSCPECEGEIIELSNVGKQGWFPGRMVYPVGGSRPIPHEVPASIAKDYMEASAVLPVSPKASAALSRRCLQAVLHDAGYKGRDLAKEINMLVNELDPSKAIPASLRQTVVAIRKFGNFSAHPISDVTSLQIIDVEDHEAEWCLDILDEMFQHFYVKPAKIKARLAALNEKLGKASKPGVDQ